MDVMRRTECPEHGDTLSGPSADDGTVFCSNPRHHEYVSPVTVEYVPASQLRGAVEDGERLREWLRYIEATTDDYNIDAAVELALKGEPVEWGQ